MFSRKANKLCNQGAWALTVITTTITFEFDAQGRMVKEIRAIEGEPLDDGVRRVETINSFYTNGKIAKTEVKNITDCEFDEYGTTFEYNEKGYLTKCSRLYGEGGDITEYTAKANNIGGVDSVEILTSGDYIGQSGYRYDANGNLRAVLFGEGKNLSETKRWGAYNNVNNENCTVNIYYEGIMTDIIKTVTENGIVTEFYLEGDQWKHFVTCKVEKQVNGEWVTDPSRRGISVLNIAQLLNQ